MRAERAPCDMRKVNQYLQIKIVPGQLGKKRRPARRLPPGPPHRVDDEARRNRTQMQVSGESGGAVRSKNIPLGVVFVDLRFDKFVQYFVGRVFAAALEFLRRRKLQLRRRWEWIGLDPLGHLYPERGR